MGSPQYNKNVECRGRPFCDDCFKSYHVLSKEGHPSTPISVRPGKNTSLLFLLLIKITLFKAKHFSLSILIAVCKICNDPSNICCFDCVGDLFCERCSELTHQALSNQKISHDDWTYIDWPDD
jgi:hypothetical protein